MDVGILLTAGLEKFPQSVSFVHRGKVSLTKYACVNENISYSFYDKLKYIFQTILEISMKLKIEKFAHNQISLILNIVDLTNKSWHLVGRSNGYSSFVHVNFGATMFV